MVCPSCGALAEDGFRFCGECGSELDERIAAPTAANAPRPVPREPVAERRLVSVLFADLVGFTAHAERRDPEEVRELLSHYFDVSRQVIVRYGGVVEKFIGDAVMAVWGTPTAREDDAERAVRAALELTAAVTALGAEVALPELRLRAGVVTGEAAITVGAEGQGMVAGDVVNTASRIQSAALPGTVLVDDATHRATDAPIAYEDAGLREVKGRAEPVHVWHATRVVAMVRGAQRATGLEAPFVGRDRELRMVKELFHATVDEGRARLVSITGQAGIGKSRLAWEFEKYIDGVAEVIFWHRGRCLSYGEGVTYWALAEMVRRRADILEGEEPAPALIKLRATLDDYVPDAEERRWLEPRVAHLLGLEDRAAPERVDLFAAWRLFFERVAERGPTVLVFDEMQWADAGLVDFIEYLLEWSRRHRLYIITLARPEIVDRHPGWGSAKRSFHSLYLEPLAPEAMEALLAGLVPGLPDEVRVRIRDRAEGIPLYAVETVRMLLDRGTLRREGNTHVLTAVVGDLDVPETLHALIAARLDSMSLAERTVLQDAAVIGQSFAKERLATLSAVDGAVLDSILDSLIRKEFLTVQADPRSPERGQYAFLQGLVQKVAYETLSKRERKARHLEVARQLEATWTRDADEIVEVIASHYLDAYRAEPDDPDAGEVRDSARRMLVRAAQRAASLAAVEEAERYYLQAAGLVEDPLERAEILEHAGDMAIRGGHLRPASEHYEAAIELFGGAGMRHRAARVSARLGEVSLAEGRLQEGVDRMEQSFSLLNREEPDADVAAMAAQLARLHFLLGHTDQGQERLELALDIAEELSLVEIITGALTTKSLFANARGRAEETTALLTHSLQLALTNELGSAALRAYYNLVDWMSKLGRNQAALDYAADGLVLARRLGDRQWEWLLLSNMVYPLYLLGGWDDAVDRAAEVRAPGSSESQIVSSASLLSGLIHIARGDTAAAVALLSGSSHLETAEDAQSRAQFLAIRAAVARAQGRHGDALRDGRAAFETVLGVARVEGSAEGFVVAMESALDLGDLAAAEELLRAGRERPRRFIAPGHLAHMHRVGARLAALQGEEESVEPGFTAAAQAFRDLASPFGLAATLLDHGEWLTQRGRHAEAAPLLDEAGEIFSRLGARLWIERLQRVRPAVVVAAPAAEVAG